MSDCKTAWENCLKYIQQQVTVSNYKTWFEPLKALKLENNQLTLEVPSKYFVETLETHYLETLSGALRSVIGPSARLQYSIRIVNNPATEIVETANAGSANGTKLSGGFDQTRGSDVINPFAMVGIKRYNFDPQLNTNYTFDTYIEGECNRLARSVAWAVAEKPAQTAFNPFFVYGNSGVGKTHLIQAIGVEIKRRDPQKNVIYLSANRFMRQYMDATRNNVVNGFINFYQMIDVLIIDDIQELSGKTSTENIFFQIFNHLQQNNKQIVIAADKKPVEILGMEERLLSRLKSGVVTAIEMPDYETRMKIIENKMAKDGIQIPNDVVRFIANNVTTNVRELEGSLVSLLATATLTHCDITMDVARKVVGSLVNKEQRDITVNYILETVCEHYGIETSSLQANTRKHEIVMARQIAMFFCKELTNTSLASIGKMLGNRNHSTVLYSCKAIANLMETDKDFNRQMKQIESKIRG